jgi:hypothetical protein
MGAVSGWRHESVETELACHGLTDPYSGSLARPGMGCVATLLGTDQRSVYHGVDQEAPNQRGCD